MMYEVRNGKKLVSTEIGELILVRPSTKAGGRMWSAYQYASSSGDLYDWYNRPSEAKQEALNDCKRYCREMGGHGFKITGANCTTFSVGFKCKLRPEDKEEVLVYITKDYMYCIPIGHYTKSWD